MLSGLKDQVQKAADGPVAIYESGPDDALFRGVLLDRATCFLDQNPHPQGTIIEGQSVLAPANCPSITTVIAALNPAHARTTRRSVTAWLCADMKVIYPQSSPTSRMKS